MRVGLLTGTFDPVHLGHVELARAAMKACKLDEVWFLVNPEPSHKQGVSELSDRVAMVRLAVANEPRMREGQPVGEVSRHTMTEFTGLMGRYPEYDFVFIVGSEVLAHLSAWEDSEQVLQRATFAVAQRPGRPEVVLDPGIQVQWFELGRYAATSSMTVRRALTAGEVVIELDDRVHAYIREHGLYRA